MHPAFLLCRSYTHTLISCYRIMRSHRSYSKASIAVAIIAHISITLTLSTHTYMRAMLSHRVPLLCSPYAHLSQSSRIINNTSYSIIHPICPALGVRILMPGAAEQHPAARYHCMPDDDAALLSANMLVDPPAVRKILEDGWIKYFSLSLLTDDKFRAVLFIDQLPQNTVSLGADGKLLLQPTPMTSSG